MPLNFAILPAQAVSQPIKRIAGLGELREEPFSQDEDQSDEKLLAKEMAARTDNPEAAAP